MNMKTIFEGQESAGKSLMMARYARMVRDRNAKWNKITGLSRPIVSNMRFSKNFEKTCKEKGVKIIYWKNLSDIVGREECDVFIDELVKYIDSRFWERMSSEARYWLLQGDKRGVWFYGCTQDFSMIEKTFRLLTKRIFRVEKWFGSRRPMKTAPPVNRIWGLCNYRLMDKKSYDSPTGPRSLQVLPSFFFITRRDCELYNTNEPIIGKSDMRLDHIERTCNECNKVIITHR